MALAGPKWIRGDMTDAGSENRRRKPKCVEVNGRREERGEAGVSGQSEAGKREHSCECNGRWKLNPSPC